MNLTTFSANKAHKVVLFFIIFYTFDFIFYSKSIYYYIWLLLFYFILFWIRIW